MKKVLLALLAVLMLFVFVSCDDIVDKGDDSGDTILINFEDAEWEVEEYEMTIATRKGSEPAEAATFKYKEGVGFLFETFDGEGILAAFSEGETPFLVILEKDAGDDKWSFVADYEYIEASWQVSTGQAAWNTFLATAKAPIVAMMNAAKATQAAIKAAGLAPEIKVTVTNGKKINNCFTNCTLYEVKVQDTTIAIAIDEVTKLPVFVNADNDEGWEITDYKTSGVTITLPDSSEVLFP